MKHNISSAMTSSTQAEQSIMTVGYRFHPTDDELFNHFLKRKTLGHDDVDPSIPEVKLCDHEPWELPGLVNTNSNDQVWYFFCVRNYKYLRSRQSNRTTKAGYWKSTGKPRKVINKRSKEEIGTKRTLVFYIKEKQNKPSRTKWIMHEYEFALNSSMATQGNFVLCKLKSKTDEKINRGQPILMVSASDLENQNLNELMVCSSCDEHEQSIHVTSGFDDRDMNEMTAISTYDNGEQDCLGDFDCENQNLDEVRTNSAGDEDKSRYHLGSYDLGNQDPNDMAAMSTSVNGKFSCLTSDFEGQNPHQKIDISASVEGRWSPIGLSPSDMSTSSNSNNVAEVDPLLSYINWLDLKELLQLDGEGSYNSAIHQMAMSPNESCSYSCFGVSVPADGIGSEIGWDNELLPQFPSLPISTNYMKIHV